ncbi:MAG: Wzz/FepE/Etk N-terminal domain-containing protein [Flavobacteriales bacterium]|nr:Wzz/FepE/Etk N-terminal domain-containing protein [Flavobacteriales bacterium]MCX7768217.1 Wzz/FepE/Etk N-terminal domain-containing protein [Flavobacteriales bacterium]MDW8410145.1 Wzz/FepE/Etk N-terminal domain-containing protein [Flavobacteriales bacterium]
MAAKVGMNSVQSQEGFAFNSTGIIDFLVRRWKPLLFITILAGVLAGAASLLIRDKYKSTVVLFPATTHSLSKVLMDVQGISRADLLAFGVEEDADQMIQILNSDEIRERIIQKYNLMEHYRINPKRRFAQTRLREKFERNISFRRTEYLSVEISVLDEDPQMAARIANDIAALLDSAKNRMQQERAAEALKILEQEYADLQVMVRELEDSLTAVRLLGINDYASQAEVLNEQYAIALARNNYTAANALKAKLDVLSRYGGAYVSLMEQLEHYHDQLALLKIKLKELRMDATRPITHKFIVNKAMPAEKKSYPRRSLIVLAACVGAFLVTLFTLIGIENYQTYKKFKSPQPA